MGISRSSRHKRSETGAQRAHYRKKRKFELGRQPASTKLGPKRIHTVRVRGGNVKYRALRLDAGNFAWGSEHITRKPREQKTRRPVKIAPGPNNPVGVVWIGLSAQGYGIHGTPEPDKVGKTQSHGCVRLTNWDALALAKLVKKGTPVAFVG